MQISSPIPAIAMFNEMLRLAVQEHYHDTDKAGRPYILHPLRVMYQLKTDDYELMAIALGHDLVEDHGKVVTYQCLREVGMSERIIEGIRCLTKLPGETYEEYKAKVKSNLDAVLVKMQDLRHNSDLRRLKGITPKDIERTVKYMQFYHELEETKKLWAKHYKQI